ncbi:MAG: PKD domain-containing protein, partial [Euryarchaeota archaeon]|nr:PKD domain-containing protein [Euryarchaeota archaeon]
MAGCFGSKDDEPEDGNDGDNNGPAMPDPPVASFILLIDGNESIADDNGSFEAATGVNVTFDASSTTGSNVTLAWDLGDGTQIGTIPEMPEDENTTGNGTGNATVAAFIPLPDAFQGNETNATANDTAAPLENAVITHAFETVGNYSVTLYATDDHNQTDAFSVEVKVALGGPAPGTWLREESKAVGTPTGGNLANGDCAALLSVPWEIVAVEANGTASSASKIVITMAATGSTGSAPAAPTSKLWFKDPAGAVIKSETTGSTAKTFNLVGPFAAGTYKVEAQICGSTASVGANGGTVAAKAT